MPWVGLKEVEKKSRRRFWLSIGIAVIYILFAITVFELAFPGIFFGGPSLDETSIGLVMLGVVVYGIPLALLFSLMEFFFRGFLGKRLIGKLGFVGGNTIQAAVYGFLVGIGFVFESAVELGLLFLMFASFGWIAGYITEKQAGGSIIPACIMNPVAIIISIFLAYFVSSL